MAKVPFQREIEDLFASDKSAILKVLGGAFVGMFLSLRIVMKDAKGAPRRFRPPRKVSSSSVPRSSGRSSFSGSCYGTSSCGGLIRASTSTRSSRLFRPRQRLPDGFPLVRHRHPRHIPRDDADCRLLTPPSHAHCPRHHPADHRWAQENTLLTVDGLHHPYGDDVTLITGPAEGPEGDLFDRAEERGLKVELMPELVRPIRPVTDWRRTAAPEAGDSQASGPRSCTRTARRRGSSAGRRRGTSGCRPSCTRSTGCRSGRRRRPAKNRLCTVAERWAARRCHAIVSVCDAMTEQALAAGSGVPRCTSTVYSGMDVEAFLNPPRSREEVRRELGLANPTSPSGPSPASSSGRGTTTSSPPRPRCSRPTPNVRFVFIGDGILRDRLIAETERLGFVRRSTSSAWSRRGEFPNCSERSTRWSTRACARGWRGSCRRPCWWAGRRSATTSTAPARSSCPRPASCSRRATSRARRRDPPARRRPGLAREARGQEGRRRFTDQFRYETMTEQLRSLYVELLAGPLQHRV